MVPIPLPNEMEATLKTRSVNFVVTSLGAPEVGFKCQPVARVDIVKRGLFTFPTGRDPYEWEEELHKHSQPQVHHRIEFQQCIRSN